jgi:integrase
MGMESYENVAIGSGEGGKYLAWHLAQSGQRTAVVERRWVGGSCPNGNCLPSNQVELTAGRLRVRRSKRGTPSVHPIQGDELRALRRREQPPSPYVFCSERGGPIAPKSFHTLISRLGERAGMAFPIHPHMLRHGCGYALANAGHDTRAIQAWMGHKNIQHTVRYTELAPDRFKDFWRN